MKPEATLDDNALTETENVNPTSLPALSERAPSSEARKKRGKALLATIAALLALSGAGVLARSWWTVGRFIESTEDAYIGGDITSISTKVPGIVESIPVKDNQPVRAGDLLLRLDDRDYRAAFAKAVASVSVQRAALANLVARRHLQEAVVAQAQAGIASADAETARARDDQDRLGALLKSSAVSVQDFQRADADFKKAQAAGEQSRAVLLAAQRQLEVIAADAMQAQASLELAQAEAETARLNCGYTEVRAPMDGIIGNRSAQVGAYSAVGSQLLSLVPTHGLWVDAHFKESQLRQIRAGMSATVRVDAIPGRVFHGRVLSLSPATGALFSVLPPENATGNFTKIVQRLTVRILLDEESLELLRPGLSVTASVDSNHSQQRDS